MTPPVLSPDDLDEAALDRALRAHGGFLLESDGVGALATPLVEEAHAFFALPREAKQRVAIERSAHFRGWSEMHNARDWREQLHFGLEQPARRPGAAYGVLEGPNLWPDSATFRARLLAHLIAMADLGERLLRAVATASGLPEKTSSRTARDGYGLLKLIAYHPQPARDAAAAPRAGVAPHADFSWLTLTWQSQPGLEIRTPDGQWLQVQPHRDRLWVHVGEILEHATRGRYSATPHRVTNHSSERTRLSIPFFVNPSLDAQVPVLESTAEQPPLPSLATESLHVHRVLPRGGPYHPFLFGEAEWRRKGLGQWCSTCVEPVE